MQLHAELVLPPTLKLANILNAGTVHEGTPSSDFSIFDPIHAFFWHFLLQNWNLRPHPTCPGRYVLAEESAGPLLLCFLSLQGLRKGSSLAPSA
jgi:hypothetical protein